MLIIIPTIDVMICILVLLSPLSKNEKILFHTEIMVKIAIPNNKVLFRKIGLCNQIGINLLAEKNNITTTKTTPINKNSCFFIIFLIQE
jgi:hypothetical protein